MNSLFKIILVCLISKLSFAAEAPEVTEEEGVIVLTDDNFDHVVENTKYLLVEFCKHLMFYLLHLHYYYCDRQ